MFWFLIFIAIGWPVMLATIVFCHKLSIKREDILIKALNEISLHGKSYPGLGFTSHKMAQAAIKSYKERHHG